MAYRVDPDVVSEDQWKPWERDHRSISDSQWRPGDFRVASNEGTPPGIGFVDTSISQEPIIITCLDSQRPNISNWPGQSNQEVLSSVKPFENYSLPPPYPDVIPRSYHNALCVQPASSNIILAPSTYSNDADRYIPNGPFFNRPQVTPPRSAPRNQVKKPKRQRTAITTDQILNLENEYKKNRYIEKFRRMQLSQELSISERVIKIWFQNRRMKEKNLKAARMDDDDDDDVYEVPYIPSSQSEWGGQNQQIQETRYPLIQPSIHSEYSSIPQGTMVPLQHRILSQIDSTVYLLPDIPQIRSQEMHYVYEF